jgi:hypothetical protein
MTSESVKTPSTVSGDVLKRMPLAVLLTMAATAAGLAVLIILAQKPAWWSGFFPATVVATLSAAASIAVLKQAAGQPADAAVSQAMLVTVVRMFVSLTGLMIAVFALHYPAEPTGLMVCAYYGTTLIVESVMMTRANGPVN